MLDQMLDRIRSLERLFRNETWWRGLVIATGALLITAIASVGAVKKDARISTGGDSSDAVSGLGEGLPDAEATDGGTDGTSGGGPGSATGGTSEEPQGGTGAGTADKICSGTVEIGAAEDVDLGKIGEFTGDPNDSLNASENDFRRWLQLGIDDLNKRGGLGGCEVQLVFYAAQVFTGSWTTQSQEMCAKFTQDHHVVAAVLMALNTQPVALDCLASHGAPVLWGVGSGLGYYGSADYKRYRGFLYKPFDINIDRWGVFIDELADRGYFDPGTKLGILYYEDDTGRLNHLVRDIWKPRLSAHRVTVASEFAMTAPRSYSEYGGDSSSQASAAVLAFRRAGVDHVLFAPDGHGGSKALFMSAAESQGYRPRYALDTGSLPRTVTYYNRPEQLNGSIAIGWAPVADVARYELIPPNPARATCEQIYKGVSSYEGQQQRLLETFLSWCEALNFLHNAFSLAPEMSATGLLSGVERLGTSFTSPVAFGPTTFSPGRYDGGTAIRALTYDAQKSSYVYSGPLRQVP